MVSICFKKHDNFLEKKSHKSRLVSRDTSVRLLQIISISAPISILCAISIQCEDGGEVNLIYEYFKRKNWWARTNRHSRWNWIINQWKWNTSFSSMNKSMKKAIYWLIENINAFITRMESIHNWLNQFLVEYFTLKCLERPHFPSKAILRRTHEIEVTSRIIYNLVGSGKQFQVIVESIFWYFYSKFQQNSTLQSNNRWEWNISQLLQYLYRKFLVFFVWFTW